MPESGTERIPLTRLQEAVLLIERAHTPWNMQVEATTAATLDAERLRAAARTAAGTYPMARARLRRDDDGPTAYAWAVSDGTDPVGPPVEVVGGDSVDLPALRRRFYGARFDLTSEPPLRLLVVRGGGPEGGDRLCVCASHVPMDGIAAFRVLQALLVAYAGGDPTPATVEASPQELMARVRPDGADRLRTLGATARRLGYLGDPPAAIAAEGGPAPPGEWRFAHRHLDAETTDRLVDGRPSGPSVNDLLLAALHLTIDEWNEARCEAAGRISLLMPMNVRPDERFFDGVGLYTLFDSVGTRPEHRRTPARTLRRVADRTDAIKSSDRQFGYLEWWHLVSAAPLSVRKRVADAVFGPGEPFLDTAVLSNLGRIPALPALPDGDLVRPWLTPPCWPPTPLSMGVVTVGDRLHVGFRYEAGRFDAAAAEAFADRYLDRLEATV